MERSGNKESILITDKKEIRMKIQRSNSETEGTGKLDIGMFGVASWHYKTIESEADERVAQLIRLGPPCSVCT